MDSPFSTLPIVAVLPELRRALAESSKVVLEAPPGAGKSTGVPLALLDESWLAGRRIVMLQPRRIAARAVARRLARLAGEAEPGGLVGYRTRLDTRVGDATRVEVVTEGILTRRLQSDPALEDTGLVIFDEFHERSLQADLGLALAVDAQRHLRDDLRLLVMSATLQGIDFAKVFDANVRCVQAPGRAYEVVTHHVGSRASGGDSARSRGPAVEQRVAGTVMRALQTDLGDALVFLPGAAEIRRTCAALASHANPQLDVLPLYGELDASQQDAALRAAAPGRRKVVVATNIAETSLTIDGVRIVVDSGVERRPRFDPNTGMSRLETVRISRASADQRRGRAGRTAPGTCYRLWSESEHAALAPQSAPEMLEADLGPLALELACWGVTDPAALAWVDLPPLATFRQARALLRDLEALDDRGQATLVGRRMAAQGVHPRLAHMLLRALPLGLARLACEVAALLTERDPLRSVGSLPEPDLRHRIDVLRDAAPPPGTAVDRGALQRVRRTADLLERRLRRDAGVERDTTSGTLEADDAAGLLLAFAYPDRIGVARRGDSGRYLLTQGRGATLVGPAALARSEFIVAASIDAGDREARIQLGAPLRRELLERHFAAALDARDEVAWDSRTGSVVARRVRRLGAVVLEEQALAGASVQGIEQAMVDGIREMGLESLPWTGELQQWRARVRLLRSMDLDQGAHTDWPDVSDTHLLATLEAWLGPYLAGITRRSQLVNVRLRDALSDLLDWTLRRRLDELAPTHVTVPSGSRIAVDYVQVSPTLAVRLQEVFGWLDSPRIAAGRLPLTLELLSPARRPVQVTRDLLSFWRHGYAEVRKELRGRYPKHYWPEDPLTATPTRKVRPPAST